MKFQFVAKCVVSAEIEALNIAHTKTLGLPYVSEKERPPLAVVGGGHSILGHIDELRAWPGDVWACGTAFGWCLRNNIKATFFCLDPQPETAALTDGAVHAIVCTSIAPETLEALKGAHVEVFDLVHEDGRTNHGCTSVTGTVDLAIRMGYRDISYFGCEGSFVTTSHAYHHEETAEKIIVRCGDEDFLTHPAYLMQAEYMAAMFRVCPLLRDRSGGLMGALVKNQDYDITHGTQGLHKLVA